MATSTDLQRSLAHHYAEAILGLAEERGEADSLLEELDQLVALFKAHEPDFEGFRSPLTNPDRRRESIERLFRGKLSDLLVDAFQVANSKRRVGLLPLIAESYRAQLDELRHRQVVTVETAVPLSEELRAEILERSARYTGKQVIFDERINPDLIAGMVIKVGDERVDTSIAKELRILGRRLMDRGRRRDGGAATEAAGPE